MNRREFLKAITSAIGIVGSSSAIIGCFPTILKEPDVVFDGTDSDAEKVSKLWPKLQSMVSHPFEQLRVGLLQNEEMKVLSLWIDDKAHLYFLDEETGQVGSLRFGWKKISPSIKFINSDSSLFGEYAFWGDKQAPALANIDTGKWFLWAIGAVAIGFGVWLMAKVGVFLLSALAFVAFNLMVLALLVAGVAIIYGAAQIFFKTTGITLDDVKEWFLGKVENINLLIRQTAEGIGG